MGVAVLMVQYWVTKTLIFATSWWRKGLQFMPECVLQKRSQNARFVSDCFLDLTPASEKIPHIATCKT